MAEPTAVSISFHGKITTEQADKLIELLEAYGLGLDTENGPNATHDNLGDGSFWGETNYGNVEDLETYCQDQGIAYEYWHDSGPEWDASTTKYWGDDRPADDFTSTHAGDVIPIDHLTKTSALSTGWAKLHERIRRWKEPMPPLEIVG